jgi:hypothetical protein
VNPTRRASIRRSLRPRALDVDRRRFAG